VCFQIFSTLHCRRRHLLTISIIYSAAFAIHALSPRRILCVQAQRLPKYVVDNNGRRGLSLGVTGCRLPLPPFPVTGRLFRE
jgi:hypothetical protein